MFRGTNLRPEIFEIIDFVDGLVVDCKIVDSFGFGDLSVDLSLANAGKSRFTVVRLRPSATRDPKTPQIRQKGHAVRLVEYARNHEVLESGDTVDSKLYCQHFSILDFSMIRTDPMSRSLINKKSIS